MVLNTLKKVAKNKKIQNRVVINKNNSFSLLILVNSEIFLIKDMLLIGSFDKNNVMKGIIDTNEKDSNNPLIINKQIKI